MAAAKGFSLIETLVAVMIASVASLALMQVVSHGSATSAKVLERYDALLVSGLLAGVVDESMHGQTMSVADLLKTRYSIDHSAILESLDEQTYEIRLLPKETMEPLIGTIDTSSVSIAIQKVTLKSENEGKSFFRLTAADQ